MKKVIIFDAFGTLFNLDKSLLENIAVAKVPDILSYAREKQLCYTWLRSLMDDYISFDKITEIALLDGCKKYGADAALVHKLIPLYTQPKTFDDVAPTLSALKNSGNFLGILSNGTHKMLESGIIKNKLSDAIDKVFSADDIKVYKPDPRVYAMVCDGLNLKPKDITFVSSNQWDVVGAANFGFKVKWVNRSKTFRESVTIKENIEEIGSLTELAKL